MTAGPFDTAWRGYHEAGYSVIPLPAGRKEPPLGPTGYETARMTTAELAAKEGHGFNLAWRLEPSMLGIDVDQHSGKVGWDNLEAYRALHALPPLPPAPRSSARGRDNPSGIRWFRVPSGFRCRGALVPGVDVIQQHHRYGCVPPSVHPGTGTVYEWFLPSGVDGPVPPRSSLPELPAEWVTHLDPELSANPAKREAEMARRAAGPKLADEQLRIAYRAWEAQLTAGPPCHRVERALAAAIEDLQRGDGVTSRHDWMLTLTGRLAMLAGHGHVGVPAALEAAVDVWMAVFTTSERETRELEAEYLRLFARDSARPAQGTADPCDGFGVLTATTTERAGG